MILYVRNAVGVAKGCRNDATGWRNKCRSNAHSNAIGHRHRAWLMIKPAATK